MTDTLRQQNGGPAAALARAVGLAVLLTGPLALAGPAAANDAAYELRGVTVKSEPVSAYATRLERNGDSLRLLFDLSGPVEVKAHPVARPNRIIVDLPEVAFHLDPGAGRAPAVGRDQAALIKSYRFGLFAPGRSRVVIDLARPAKIVRASSVAAKDGARLEIDLAPTDAASFADAAAAQANALPPAPAEPLVAAQPTDPADRPIVVIDPGHGGVDMGATGKHGEQEKAIVFEFAKALHARIEASGRLRAVMTRNEDVFVSLDDRVRFARRNNAALFLSIHADTLGEESVEGATIYTVSAKASDAESAKIAEKENFADQAAGLERKEDAEEVGDILFELAQRETRAYSRQFSQTLIARWKEASSLNKNPARSAGFVVLKAHDVPSVLLELGYLSSEKDLARLTSKDWRERAAEKTAQAIEAFFATRNREASAPAQATAAAQRPQ